MICHTESQSISLFCSYNYNALTMQKQMIMEQYRNNKTLNSWVFFLFLHRCKSNWMLHHKHNRLMKWLMSSQNVSTIIYYLQTIIMLHIRFVMYWLFQQYINCSIKINSPQLMGKTRHKIMLKTR